MRGGGGSLGGGLLRFWGWIDVGFGERILVFGVCCCTLSFLDCAMGLEMFLVT